MTSYATQRHLMLILTSVSLLVAAATGHTRAFDRLYDSDAGVFSTCALDESGARCWGYGSTPNVPPLINPTKIRTSWYSTFCAIDDTGVVCWGNSQISNVPSLVDPIDVDVYGDGKAACALDANGVTCWGPEANNLGPAPQLINPKSISLTYGGPLAACVIDDSGVTCWGDNTYGTLDAPVMEAPIALSLGSASGCAIDSAQISCWGFSETGITQPPLLQNPTDVSVAGAFACAISDEGATCWGAEGLPNCNSTNCGPGAYYGYREEPPLEDPFMITAGYTQVCGFTETGADCWGRNLHGEATDQALVFSLPPDLTTSIVGSDLLECSDFGTGNGEYSVVSNFDLADPIISTEWFVDGDSLGLSDTILANLPLGISVIKVEVTTLSGQQASDSILVEVVDTTSPTIEIAFVDKLGNSISQISRNGLHDLSIQLNAYDICDMNVTAVGNAGVNVVNGTPLGVHATQEEITLSGTAMTLTATSEDDSGNTTSEAQELLIVD